MLSLHVRDKTGVTCKGFSGIWLISGSRTRFNLLSHITLWSSSISKTMGWKAARENLHSSIKLPYVTHLRALEVNRFEPQFIVIFWSGGRRTCVWVRVQHQKHWNAKQFFEATEENLERSKGEWLLSGETGWNICLRKWFASLPWLPLL